MPWHVAVALDSTSRPRRQNRSFVTPHRFVLHWIGGGESIQEQIRSVPSPEQHCLQRLPHLCTSPMLAEHVSRVHCSRDVVEVHRVGRYRFTSEMIGQCVVSLLQRGMQHGGTGDNGFVVSKHLRGSLHGHSTTPEGGSVPDDLLHCRFCGHELRTVGGTFNSGLLLGAPRSSTNPPT